MWKKISSKQIYSHPRITLEEDIVLLPNNLTTSYLRVIEPYAASVTVICLQNDDILIQEEYSYPINRMLLQFPGGKVEKGETPLTAAKRELIEESGIQARDVVEIGWYYTNNRRSDHKMIVYLAKKIKMVPKLGGDLEEKIKSKWVSIKNFEKLISAGEINNFSMLSAWALYRTINEKN